MDLTDGLLSSCPIFLSSFFPCMVLGLYKVKDLQLCVSHSCDVCRGRLLTYSSFEVIYNLDEANLPDWMHIIKKRSSL